MSNSTDSTLRAAPKLNPGEHWAGIIIDDDGKPSYHLIGLPGEIENATWDEAVEWAKSVGGELPSRRELAWERVNAALHFKPDWYWSGEQHADARVACYQFFINGLQGYDRKDIKLRARAVRRIPTQEHGEAEDGFWTCRSAAQNVAPQGEKNG